MLLGGKYDNIKAQASADLTFTGPKSEDQIEEEIRERDGDVIILPDPDEYPEGLPTLAFDDTAKMLVIVPDFSESYDVKLNVGTATKTKSGHIFHYSEPVSFGWDTTASLRYIPIGPVSGSWLGNAGGPGFSFEGKKVVLTQPHVGTLMCSYNIRCDKWDVKLTLSEAAAWLGIEPGQWVEQFGSVEVVVVAIQGAKKNSTTIDFTTQEIVDSDVELDDDGLPIRWEVYIEDTCERLPVPGAISVINGVEYVADANAVIQLGQQPKGKTHTIVTTLPGVIVPTNEDKLANDGFTT